MKTAPFTGRCTAIKFRLPATLAFAGLAVLMLSGCGTITRGPTETFVLETTPPGATARLSSGQTCTTPCSLSLPRKLPFMVHIERDGYEPVDATVSSGMGGAGAATLAGNILAGGIIGLAIDAGTGASLELEPDPLRVTLVAAAPKTPTPAMPWSPAPAAPSPDASVVSSYAPCPASLYPAPAPLDYSVPAEVRAQPGWWQRD